MDRLHLRHRAAGLPAPAGPGVWWDWDVAQGACQDRDVAWSTCQEWDTAQGASQSHCTPKLSPLQALKYECYLDSPLVRFLMKRAICDLKITHYFFWWVWGVPAAAREGTLGLT